jgi:hypothetical protein
MFTCTAAAAVWIAVLLFNRSLPTCRPKSAVIRQFAICATEHIRDWISRIRSVALRGYSEEEEASKHAPPGDDSRAHTKKFISFLIGTAPQLEVSKKYLSFNVAPSALRPQTRFPTLMGLYATAYVYFALNRPR